MRFDHSLTAAGIVSGSPERAHVRNFAKRWQMMVLAGPRHLKDKVYSSASLGESNRSNLWMDFDGIRESTAQNINGA
jgi:hypothetical protein